MSYVSSSVSASVLRQRICSPLIVAGMFVALVLAFLAPLVPHTPVGAPHPQDAGGLAFVPNQGQSDPAVRFQSTAQGGSLFFTPAEVVLALPAAPGDNTTATLLRLRFEGANPAPQIVAGEQLPGRFNAIVGADPRGWHTGLPTYGAITYRALYSGVDMRYEGQEGNLKSTYLVAPGADARLIRWRYQGASRQALTSTGSLVLDMPDGRTIVEQAPIAWQERDGRRSYVPVQFVLDADQSVHFALGAYDASRALTIDPTLNYSTYLRGASNSTDAALDVAIADENGTTYAYVTGYTFSVAFPSAGSPQTAGTLVRPDLFVTKIDPGVAGSASHVYTTVIGGDGSDRAYSLIAQADGQVFVAGATGSPDFPTAATSTLDTSYGGGATDGFVAGLSADGAQLTFMTFLGGAGNDVAYGLDGSAAGLAVAGVSNSRSGFPAAARTGYANNGGDDAFVTLLNNVLATPSAGYFSYLGGDDSDGARAVALSGGQIFLAGWTQSFNTPMQITMSGAAKTSGDSDAFVARLNPAMSGAGSLVYSRLAGGSANDEARGVRVTASQQAYIVGTTSSNNFQMSAGALKATKSGGDTDAFVAGFTAGADGQPGIVAATYLGGSANDEAHDLAIAPNGTIFVTGSTQSADFGLLSLQPYSGSDDAFVAKLRANLGSRFYTSYFGGAGSDVSYGLAVDDASQVYLAGTTNSTAFSTPPANSGFEMAGGGSTYGTDGFFAQLVNAPPTLTSATLTVAEGGSVVVTGNELIAGDADDSTDALVFTLTTAPVNGSLKLDGTLLAAGATFTYADVLAGRLSYTHDGGETTTDSFELTLSDGVDTTSPVQVPVSITPANDPPTMNPQSFSLAETAQPGDTVGTIVWNDPENAPGTFAETGGTGAALFDVTSAGMIVVAPGAAFDFESGNTTYTLAVELTSGGDTVPASMTITITAVNEPPVITPGQVFTVVENSLAGTAVSTVQASDPDAAATLTFSITGGNTNGAFAIDPASGALRVGNAAMLDYETTPVFTLTINVSDGALSDSKTVTINLVNSNDAPVLTLGAAGPGFAENGSPAAVAPNASVGDLDSPDFDTGSLSVAIQAAAATDQLTIENQGSGPGQIGVSGSDISFGGASIGTLTVNSPSSLVIALNANATPAAVQALVRQVRYASSSDAFAAGASPAKNVQFTLNDGDGASASASASVAITGLNDAPVLDPAGTMILTSIPENVAPASNSGTSVLEIIASAGGDRITDVDNGAVEGIAVVGANSANGTWEFSLTRGTWVPFGTPSAANAILLAPGARIRFVPAPNFNGQVNPGITFHAWDQTSGANGDTGANLSATGGATPFSSAAETAEISVTSVNQAPVLDPSGAMRLDPLAEDTPAAAIPGTLVSAMIASAGGDRITDVDTGALEGIAVVGVDATHGSWQFSLDGTTWTDITNPDDTAAVLLASDATTRVRFVPALNYHGTLDPAITLRAWDQTSGANGATNVDVSANGDPTAISVATETASILVTPVNDPPTATDDQLSVEKNTADNLLDVLANDSVAPDSNETLRITAVGAASTGSVQVNAAGDRLVYTPPADFEGFATFSYTITDSNNTTATATVTVRVGPYRLMLPLVLGEPLKPDLEITSFSVTPNQKTFAAGEPVQISVTIRNNGTLPAGAFWADLYINPSVAPETANIPWESVCGMQPCFGVAWYVEGGLAGGQSITLTSDAYYPRNTRWEGFFARGTTDLYVYVDSWNGGVPGGAILERDETNNRAELHAFSVTGATPSLNGLGEPLPARPLPGAAAGPR